MVPGCLPLRSVRLARVEREYLSSYFGSIIGSREGIMHSRQLSVFPVLAALILYLAIYPLPARSSTSREENSNQDQNKAADAGKPASGEQAKAPASDIKSAPTDEGQLATVNNAKI